MIWNLINAQRNISSPALLVLPITIYNGGYWLKRKRKKNVVDIKYGKC